MIVTISGASGVGKTTIERGLLNRLANAAVVVSVTTRERRENDNPGEYIYASRRLFWLLEKLGAFLWTVDVHGNKYGTSKRSVKKALKRYDDISVMILVPDRVNNLLEYVKEHGGIEGSVISFYIISPHPEILRERLIARGDSKSEIEKRIQECKKWDLEALSSRSDSSYIFIRNDDKIENAVEDMIYHINEEVNGQLF